MAKTTQEIAFIKVTMLGNKSRILNGNTNVGFNIL